MVPVRYLQWKLRKHLEAFRSVTMQSLTCPFWDMMGVCSYHHHINGIRFASHMLIPKHTSLRWQYKVAFIWMIYENEIPTLTTISAYWSPQAAIKMGKFEKVVKNKTKHMNWPSQVTKCTFCFHSLSSVCIPWSTQTDILSSSVNSLLRSTE